MIRYPIKYTNFADKEVEKDLYFNLTMTQVANIQRDLGGGKLVEQMQRHIDSGNVGEQLEFLERLALHAIGERSEDGEYFDNSPETQERIAKSAAFQAFNDELRKNDKKAAEWFIGILPKELQRSAREAWQGDQDKPVGAPPLPPGAQARVQPEVVDGPSEPAPTE